VLRNRALHIAIYVLYLLTFCEHMQRIFKYSEPKNSAVILQINSYTFARTVFLRLLIFKYGLFFGLPCRSTVPLYGVVAYILPQCDTTVRLGGIRFVNCAR